MQRINPELSSLQQEQLLQLILKFQSSFQKILSGQQLPQSFNIKLRTRDQRMLSRTDFLGQNMRKLKN